MKDRKKMETGDICHKELNTAKNLLRKILPYPRFEPPTFWNKLTTET